MGQVNVKEDATITTGQVTGGTMGQLVFDVHSCCWHEMSKKWAIVLVLSDESELLPI